MRRRGRSPTIHEGTNTRDEPSSLMDDQDQSDIVAALEKEAEDLMRQFKKYFGFIGYGGISISLLFPLLCQEECKTQLMSCIIHAIYASVLHYASIRLCRNDDSNGNDFPWFVMTFILVAAPMLLWIMGAFHDDIEYFHIGLAVANITTFSGCMLLRWDQSSTTHSLNELDNLKYDHKTL